MWYGERCVCVFNVVRVMPRQRPPSPAQACREENGPGAHVVNSEFMKHHVGDTNESDPMQAIRGVGVQLLGVPVLCRALIVVSM